MSSLNESAAQPQSSIDTIKDKRQQHHQRSLPNERIEKVKISPVAVQQWKLYRISTNLNVTIVTGSDASNGSPSKVSNLMRNKQQIMSYCIAAIAYARIYLEENWKPDDIDKILDIGWNINRRASRKRPMNSEHQSKIGDMTDVFYIDSIKFVTLTKSSYAGIIFNSDCNSIKVFSSALKEMAKQSCLVEHNRNFFSIWQTDDEYFIFHPMSICDTIPKCVHLANFECLEKYLLKIFVAPQTEYTFHSVEFLRINNQVLQREETAQRCFNTFFGKTLTSPTQNSLNAAMAPHKMCLMPEDNQFFEKFTSYDHISEVRDILRSTQTVSRSAKIQATCVAAVVTQYVKKAFTWASNTLDDIIELGSTIYKDNLKPEGQAEVHMSDIKKVTAFGSFQCLIDIELAFFGKVESSISSVCNLEQGLTDFFTSNSIGIVDGPNVVTIWNEGKYYYMYDPKGRDRFGGKLTKTKDEEKGMSCVTRYTELRVLVEIYIENVDIKQRHECYKIIRVEVTPVSGENWFEWKVISPEQWCLRGKVTHKLKPMHCISIMALLYAENIPAKDWSSDLVDEIASVGGQYCSEFNLKNMKSDTEVRGDIVFRDAKSGVHITPKIFRYVVNELTKNIENHLIRGFSLFFEANHKGIFSFNTPLSQKYFAVWKSSGDWYTYGYHQAQHHHGQKSEILTVSRFTNHIDLVKSLTSNIMIRKHQEYSLSKVNFCKDNQWMDHSQCKNYSPLKVQDGFAGILRIGSNCDLIEFEDCYETPIKKYFYVASVLALTHIKDCWTWSSYDVCDILKLSLKSYLVLHEHFKDIRHFFIKIGHTTFEIKDFQRNSGTLPNSSANQAFCNKDILNIENKLVPLEAPGSNECEKDGKTEKETALNECNVEMIAEEEVQEVENMGLNTDIKQESDIDEHAKDELNDKGMEGKNNHIEDIFSGIDLFKSGTTLDQPDKSESVNETEKTRNVLRDSIGTVLNEFDMSDSPCASFCTKQLHYGIWKEGSAFFVFNPQLANGNGIIKSPSDDQTATFCPYVAWFSSLKCLLEHLITNIVVVDSDNYEFIYFKFKTKIGKIEANRSWYNFSLVDRTSDQWMIRALYGSLQDCYGPVGCVIALAFASVLQPSDWNSAMLDNILKYGIKLYNKSKVSDSKNTELDLCDVISPFIIGCYVFSFTSTLFESGANELDFLNKAINNLFIHSNYGIISSKGYSAAIWKQNDSYFMFDPHIKNVTCLSRFSDTKVISKKFLAHVASRMLGVNVCEIFKVYISSEENKRKDCPVDTNAISKLANRPSIANNFINRDMSRAKLFRKVSDNADWLEFMENSPTECYVLAACAMANFKNADLWTSHTINEILKIGNKIFLTSIKKMAIDDSPKAVQLQPSQIQGMYPFDSRNLVNIRSELFSRATGKENKATNLKDKLNSALTNFFEIWDNAFLMSPDFKVSVWKQAARFYLFYCQPINEDGRLAKVGETEAVLFKYNCLNDLFDFLLKYFDGNNDEDWFDIRHIDFTFVPSKQNHDMEKGSQFGDQKNKMKKDNEPLTRSVCNCSQNIEEHKRKHPALCLAGIIMSTIHHVSTWSPETLRQIEDIGKGLYEDVLLVSNTKNAEFTELRRTQDIQIDKFKLHIECDNLDHDLVYAAVEELLKKLFVYSPTLCIMIEDTCLSIISNEDIYFVYDPNGVDDEEKKVRPCVSHFSSLESLVSYIVKVGVTIASTKFSINYVQVVSDK